MILGLPGGLLLGITLPFHQIPVNPILSLLGLNLLDLVNFTRSVSAFFKNWKRPDVRSDAIEALQMDHAQHVMDPGTRGECNTIRQRREFFDDSDWGKGRRDLMTMRARGAITGTKTRIFDEHQVSDFEFLSRTMWVRESFHLPLRNGNRITSFVSPIEQFAGVVSRFWGGRGVVRR
jgi:hypothetical protein